jgi:septal ring factor EnvC (AmiA/AmiB activator)
VQPSEKNKLLASQSEKTLSRVEGLIQESVKYSRGETMFPSQVIEELKSKNSIDELDTVTRSSKKRRSVVPLTASEAAEAFTDAVESLVAEVEKNTMIQQFEVMKLTTELSLQEQGIDRTYTERKEREEGIQESLDEDDEKHENMENHNNHEKSGNQEAEEENGKKVEEVEKSEISQISRSGIEESKRSLATDVSDSQFIE